MKYTENKYYLLTTVMDSRDKMEEKWAHFLPYGHYILHGAIDKKTGIITLVMCSES